MTQDPLRPQGEANPNSLLSLEDRLLVALAGRGQQRIGQFIEKALDEFRPTYLSAIADEALVLALEDAVEVGDDGGLPAAERQGVSGVDAALHREPDVRP